MTKTLTTTPLAVAGIRMAATSAGIKKSGANDVCLIEIDAGASVAAVFTQNAFCAAPVTIAKRHLEEKIPRYLLINSGNANAGTGQQGIRDALACCNCVAQHVGCKDSEVLPFSTGVIGESLPVDKISAVLPSLVSNLKEDAWCMAADSIMTTDTVLKTCSTELIVDNQKITLTGMAKGAGMIRPDMATMLAYIATDAKIEPDLLRQLLHEAVEVSFNRITVDGDTSTNDACVLIATGKSDVVVSEKQNLEEFKSAVINLCQILAKAIVRDGEGATKFIEIQVSQGQSEKECRAVAYTIAHSSLVKTAFFASDPNWGRILAAVGRSGVTDLILDRVNIYLDDICIVERGGRAPAYTEEQGQAVMQQSDITIRIDLGRGDAISTIWTCDLSYDYVRINAEYRT